MSLTPVNKTIRLGITAIDVTSGFTGTIVQWSEHMNGNIRWAIQPKGSDPTSMPDAMMIDGHLIDYVDDGISDRVTPPTYTGDILLGEKVKDIATGFEGIAIAKNLYINGCVSFSVVPKAIPTDLLNQNSSDSCINSERIARVNEGINKKLDAPKAAENGKIPGGPPSRMASKAVKR